MSSGLVNATVPMSSGLSTAAYGGKISRRPAAVAGDHSASSSPASCAKSKARPRTAPELVMTAVRPGGRDDGRAASSSATSMSASSPSTTATPAWARMRARDGEIAGKGAGVRLRRGLRALACARAA